MKRSLFTFAAVAVLACLATASQAAVVQALVTITGPGTFDVTLEASHDNSGIVSYGLPLEGPITSVDHNSPWSPFAQDGGFVGGTAGFSFLRSADDALLVGASQDTITPTPHLIPGFGQVGGDFASAGLNPLGGAPDGAAWNSPLLVASGTFDESQGLPSIGLGATSGVFVNVFASGGGVEPAEVVGIPEPTALALCSMAMVGVFFSRRRS